MRFAPLFLAAALTAALAACGDGAKTALPVPQEPGPDAVGTICRMTLAEHHGPKGQVFLKAGDRPLWFSSVRDTFTWLLMDEGLGKSAAAIWVNDMGQAHDWDQPEAGRWVEARKAVFVVGSDKGAAMGGSELVPFSDPAAAKAFVAAHGGMVMPFAAITADILTGHAATPKEGRHHD